MQLYCLTPVCFTSLLSWDSTFKLLIWLVKLGSQYLIYKNDCLIRNLQFWFETPGPYSFPVLRIRIRDPVPFWPLVPGSGMDKKSRSGSGTNNPDHISESLDKTLLVLKNPNFFYADPGTGIFMTMFPGWKNSEPKRHQWIQIVWV